MADFAFIAQPGKHPHRFFDGNRRVDPVKLIEVDPLDAKVTKTAFHTLPQERLAPVQLDVPILRRSGAGLPHAALRANNEPMRVWSQGVTNQPLVIPRSVRASGIDEVDAQLDHTS